MSKDKIKPPTPQEENASAKEYWDNYGKWVSDANQRYERDVSDINARYAASGNASNALVKTLVADRKTKYDATIKSLETGEHGRSLQKYFDKQKQLFTKAITKDYSSKYNDGNPIKGRKSRASYDVNFANVYGFENAKAQEATLDDVDISNLSFSHDFASRIQQKESPFAHIIDSSAADESQERGIKNRKIIVEGVNQLSLNDYYTSQFGAVDSGKESSPDQDRASAAASGRSTRKGSTASAESGSDAWW